MIDTLTNKLPTIGGSELKLKINRSHKSGAGYKKQSIVFTLDPLTP